jgi:DNA-binding NarL/FixJ family response regulator
MHKAKILLIDDHPLLRQGLAQLVNQEDDLVLCGEAEDGPSAMKAVELLAPDIAVVDLTLKDRSGTDLIKQLAQAYPKLKMLVFSMHDEWLHAERALQSGARGYVMKHEPPEQVLEAIRRVLAGEIYLSQRMSARVLNRLAGGKGQEDQTPISTLSDRELQIFTMIGLGNSTREIAESLSVSVKTVETHRERIKDKLSLKNATELLRFAMRYTHNL